MHQYLEVCVTAALAAGTRIRTIAERAVEARSKTDGSPVTNADAAAEACILETIRAAGTGFPVIAEESFSARGHGPEPCGNRSTGWSIRWTARKSF